jgi:hypothetical protein
MSVFFKWRYLVLSAALVFAGCSAYKQLEPKPLLSPAENGYIELKNGKKDFELKKKSKYFIQFPAPADKNYYLIASFSNKKKVQTTFTDQLIDKKKFTDKINDESTVDTLCVFPIQPNTNGYYLLLDQINEDLTVKMNYRYVPQWRFKFENKYVEFLSILENNRVDRKNYNAIGNGYHLDGINYQLAADTITKHRMALDNVYKELLAIESIFPASILNSQDKAYQNYLKLKSDIEEEVKFQNNFTDAIKFFGKEFYTRNIPLEFIKAVDDFTAFFIKKDQFPGTIISEAQSVIGNRITEVVPFYEQRISGKEDITPFDENLYLTSNLFRTRFLYEAAGLPIAPEYIALAKYVKDFDAKSISFANAKDSMGYIVGVIKKFNQMPDDEFFRIAAKKTLYVQSLVPTTIDATYGKYQQYKATAKLNEDLSSFKISTDNNLARYREAETLVPQLNILKSGKDYSTMISLLRQNAQLDFLVEKYQVLDKMCIDEQAIGIGGSLNDSRWSQAEELLRKLHEDVNYLNLSAILAVKGALVESYEDSLYTRIDRTSRIRITEFLDAHVNNVENIDSLYSDSVFLPVYNVTFSSGSRNELIQRKNNLIADLAKMKDDEFPARAIKILFDQFTANPNDNGVLKARAIVSHGKYYKADDKKIKQRIAECDPFSAKWIVKPKEYRRVFVLPVTDSKRGKNKYVVRFNVDIPTEANFPVYDVNIKLPKEIAANAATTQWYESITLNKVPLKNEGRFSITAPTPANDYECQITPVQMNKDKSNILEITLYDDSFKVYSFSVMVQKPIIKKN